MRYYLIIPRYQNKINLFKINEVTHSKGMLIISNKINFVSIMSILFIFLFSIVDNDIITVHSSVENSRITDSTQSDRNSNFTNVQWKKFVNETIGISFEYPSNWEGGTGIEGYYHISPKLETFPSGEYPWGTHFNLFYGKPSFDNLEVLTRVWAADVLDRSYEYRDYEITKKPNMEKYTIDGEKAGAFSYKEINDVEDMPDLIFNLEVINVLKNGKSFIFEFSYPPNKFDEKNMTHIKDHILNSIKWLHKEKNNDNTNLLYEQSDSVKEKLNLSSNIIMNQKSPQIHLN